MSQANQKVQLLIECDRASQIEIEEICLNKGFSISQYFLNLHKLNTQEGWTANDNLLSGQLTPEMKEFHDEFESKAQQGKPQAQPVMVRQKKSKGGKK